MHNQRVSEGFKLTVFVVFLILLSGCGGGGGGGGSESQTNENNDMGNLGEGVNSLSQIVGECELSESQEAMLQAVNQARSETRFCGSQSFESTAALQWNCQLAQASRRHSIDMAREGAISHAGSDGSSMRDRVVETGYRFLSLGENVAAGYASVSDVMTGWLNSSGHCANIMNGSYTELGAAVEFNADSPYQYYWTQNFGRPQ